MATFATRLKELREEKGLTQEELAKKLKTSRSRISMYEMGQREPDFEMQEAIADFFNIDMDYLQGRTSIKKAVDFHYAITKEFNIDYPANKKIDEAIALYAKYLLADKKTQRMIDILLEESEQ